MTGAQTECISIPTCERAANLVLVVSKVLFQALHASNHDGLDDEADRLMCQWGVLRRVAAKFVDNRDVVLSPDLRERMIGALKAAHEVAHDGDVTRGLDAPPVSSCTCHIAQTIQDLTLMVCSSEGVPCA